MDSSTDIRLRLRIILGLQSATEDEICDAVQDMVEADDMAADIEQIKGHVEALREMADGAMEALKDAPFGIGKAFRK